MSAKNHLLNPTDSGNWTLSNSSDQTIQTDDQTLWKSFKEGSESAFISIYERHFHLLANYGLQFLKDKDCLKDLIQDLFIEIRKNRANLSNTDSIKLYLYKSIRRKIFKFIKRRDKVQLVQEFPFQITYHIEHTIIQNQTGERRINLLNAGLKNLTSRQREAIYFYFYEDLSYDQIKDLMGFSQTRAVRNLIYRAIKELRKTFQSSN